MSTLITKFTIIFKDDREEDDLKYLGTCASAYLPTSTSTIRMENISNKSETRDVPGGPGVKTSPSPARGVGLIPSQGARIPHASWPKNQNIKQKQAWRCKESDATEKQHAVTNSIKSF